MPKTVKSQAKVLISDAGFSVMPILTALKKNGYFVGVCGASPRDPCHQFADESFPIDYSKSQILEKVFVDNKYDYLVPGCTDLSYLSSAKVAQSLGLPGYDSDEISQIIFNKKNFRQWSVLHGVSSPKYTDSIDEINTLTFPILAKPVDLFSGRGILKYENILDVENNFINQAIEFKQEKYIFEEFVSGNLYSHSVFIRNQKIDSDFFVKEYCTVNPYQVNSSCMDISLDENIKNKIRSEVEKIASELSITDGLFHSQFISDNNRFWFIESTRRCPGDLYSKLIEFSTGINYADLYIQPFCGSKISKIKKQEPKIKYFSRHTLSSNKNTTFNGISCSLESKNLVIVNLKTPGDKLRAAPFDRAAILFFEFDTESKMDSITPLIVDHVHLI
jgi:biotin carboxylase